MIHLTLLLGSLLAMVIFILVNIKSTYRIDTPGERMGRCPKWGDPDYYKFFDLYT